MEGSRTLAIYQARREGIVLVPYRDRKGWSQGCGHYLGKAEPQNKEPWTVKQSLTMLLADINKRAPEVQRYLTVPIEQNQFDALLDLYFQGGTDGLIAVAKIINTRDPRDPETVLASNREAAREFLNWDTDAEGTHMAGLLSRRGRNVGMYTAGEYGSDLDAVPMWPSEEHLIDGRPQMKKRQWYQIQPEDWPDA